jgi:hypothetical protein
VAQAVLTPQYMSMCFALDLDASELLAKASVTNSHGLWMMGTCRGLDNVPVRAATAIAVRSQ